MKTKLPHFVNCWKRITLFQSIIKTSKFQQWKSAKYPIICLLQFLTIFLHQGRLPLITCVTQLVSKCEKYIRCTIVLKLSSTQDQQSGAVPHGIKQSVSLCDFKIKNVLRLIILADYAKILTSSRIHLRRLTPTSFTTVSTQLTLIGFTQFYASVNASFTQLFHGYYVYCITSYLSTTKSVNK